MNRILLREEMVGEDGSAVLEGDVARHIRNVLRSQAGDRLKVGILNGNIGDAEIVSITRDHVSLLCRCETSAEPLLPMTMVLALPRPRMMNRLFSIFASMGVKRIVVTGAERVEKSYFDAHVLEGDVIHRQLIDGLIQGGVSTTLPETAIYHDLGSCLAREAPGMQNQKRWLFDQRGEPFISGLIDSSPVELCLAVGPEGGWTDADRCYFSEYGFSSVSLGSRIYRTEVACITALGMLNARG